MFQKKKYILKIQKKKNTDIYIYQKIIYLMQSNKASHIRLNYQIFGFKKKKKREVSFSRQQSTKVLFSFKQYLRIITPKKKKNIKYSNELKYEVSYNHNIKPTNTQLLSYVI
jgi:hypothetical protein